MIYYQDTGNIGHVTPPPFQHQERADSKAGEASEVIDDESIAAAQS